MTDKELYELPQHLPSEPAAGWAILTIGGMVGNERSEPLPLWKRSVPVPGLHQERCLSKV